jgi:hypothetical protein
MANGLQLRKAMEFPSASSIGDRGPSPSTGRRTGRVATLDNFVLETGCADGVGIESLEPGCVVRVDTRYSVYHLLILDATKRHVLVKGGTPFPDLTEARVEGATGGGSLMKAGWVGVGLRLELSIGTHRVLTSRVQSVTVGRKPIE